MYHKGWVYLNSWFRYYPEETDKSERFLYTVNCALNLNIYPDIIGPILVQVDLKEYFLNPYHPTPEELIMFELEYRVPTEILKEVLGLMRDKYENI